MPRHFHLTSHFSSTTFLCASSSSSSSPSRSSHKSDDRDRRHSNNSRDLKSEVNWLRRRKRAGALYRVPHDFYQRMWSLLAKVKGLSILSDTIDSTITLAEMTPGEKNFALRVERLLMNITVPEERQIIIEALMALSAIVKQKAEQGQGLGIDVIALDKYVLSHNTHDTTRHTQHDTRHTQSNSDVGSSYPQAH
jgi:hypothetical protein